MCVFCACRWLDGALEPEWKLDRRWCAGRGGHVHQFQGRQAPGRNLAAGVVREHAEMNMHSLTEFFVTYSWHFGPFPPPLSSPCSCPENHLPCGSIYSPTGP